MKGHQPQNSKNVSYVTPQWILQALPEFDLDPCTPDEMPWETAANRYTLEQDGLKQPWSGKVWLNPPFDKGSREAFLEKMSQHGQGVAIVPASTETEWFKKYVWGFATSILFLDRRPYFHLPNGDESRSNSGCSICLVGYGSWGDAALSKSNLGTYLPIPKVESQEAGQ